MATKTAKKPVAIDRDHGLHLLHEMLRIRRFEEKCAELYTALKIRGFLHLYDGEEACAVGIMQALTPEDAVVATYREHGQALARGVPMTTIMAEMYGKREGCSGGRGGSMHLFDSKTRFMGGNAIVAGGIPLAVGLALADKMQGRQHVTCCFHGDGAAAEGSFYESLNLSVLWQVPALFICENNLYAMGTAIRYSHGNKEIAEKAAAIGVTAVTVDGMDVLAVEAAAKKAAAAVRAGKGPHFIECLTYRFRAHSMFDAELYRSKDEVETWMQRDPIPNLIGFMKVHDLISDADVETLEQQVAAEIAEAVAFAEAGTWEPIEEMARFVYSEGSPA
jgi:pyruvate dehydrogenase E1 component alpha subunit